MALIEDGEAYVEASPTARCFLCRPDPDLFVARGASTTVVAGLGPLCEGYVVVASREHVPSLADLHATDPSAVTEVTSVRSRLARAFGRVIMTEHGRVPLCRDDADDHEGHCFHAHALMFPVDVSIRQRAATYYLHTATFNHLDEALGYAASADSYLLLSEEPTRYDVLTHPLNAPRQLARTLVAHALGDMGAADWRSFPDLPGARRNAACLRRLWPQSAQAFGPC